VTLNRNRNRQPLPFYYFGGSLSYLIHSFIQKARTGPLLFRLAPLASCQLRMLGLTDPGSLSFTGRRGETFDGEVHSPLSMIVRRLQRVKYVSVSSFTLLSYLEQR